MRNDRREREYSPCGTLSPAGVLNRRAGLPAGLEDGGEVHIQLVHLEGTRWSRGALRVWLLDGTGALRERIRTVASRWTEFANIELQFGTSPESEIRVSLLQNGINESAVGARALDIAADLPTMRLGNLRENAPASEFDYFVLHEFGHALGLVHEHQSPNGLIPWNRPQVYADCLALYGWERPTVDREILEPYEAAATTATPFDRLSIMNYPVLPDWTQDGTIIRRPSTLSNTDQEFIARLYPR